MNSDYTKWEMFWMILVFVIPTILLSSLASQFSEDPWLRIFISSILGGLGAGIGSLLFMWMKSHSIRLKWGVLIIEILVFSGLSYSVNQYQNELIMCEICGYDAVLRKTNTQCNNCGSNTWKEEKQLTDFSTKRQWLFEEQIFYFTMPTSAQNMGFTSPEYEGGFHKNRQFRPVVTMTEIKNYRK